MHQASKTGWISSHCSSHKFDIGGSPCDVSPDGLRMASRCACCLRSTVCCLSQEAVGLRLHVKSNFLARADCSEMRVAITSAAGPSRRFAQRWDISHVGGPV